MNVARPSFTPTYANRPEGSRAIGTELQAKPPLCRCAVPAFRNANSHWLIDRFNVRECSDGPWRKTAIRAYIESRAHTLNRFGKVDCTSPKSAECLTGCSLSAGPLQRHSVKSMYVGLQEPCILHSQPLRKTCRETFSRWIEE